MKFLKSYWLWIVFSAVVLYFFVFKKKAAMPSNAVKSTNTAANAPNPFWDGWNAITDIANKNTTGTVNKAVNTAASLSAGVRSFIPGGSSTGAASKPTTNGSGAGVPVDDSDSNNGNAAYYSEDDFDSTNGDS